MTRALSSNARAMIVRCLRGEEMESSEGTVRAQRELEGAGLLESDSTRPTSEAWRRRREFLPHQGPLSREALGQLERHLSGDREVTEENRAAYRELAAAGLMKAGHSFAGGDESVYRLTEAGFAQQADLLAPFKSAV